MMLCVFSDICLQPGTIGGFEADSTSLPSHDSLDMVDGKSHRENVPEKVRLDALQNALCSFIHTFSRLPINDKDVMVIGISLTLPIYLVVMRN